MMLTLLMGVRSDFAQRVVLEVRINGKKHTHWEVGDAMHRRRNEAYLEIPGSVIRGRSARFTLRVAGPARAGFAAYHYFFLQSP